jgi:3D (Asp-Asp-Asp) domain-containing protein
VAGQQGQTERITVVSRAEKWQVFEATGYCSCVKCCVKSDGITASGTRARPGVIAVDPEVIPQGSTVYIQGMGEFAAEDVGGAIRGKRIDIWFPDHGTALEFGRKMVRVKWGVSD